MGIRMNILYRALLVFLIGIASEKFCPSAYKLQRVSQNQHLTTKQAERQFPLHYRATHGHALHQAAVDEPTGIFRRKNLPIFGAAVGLTALFFQIFILYPWHELLRDDFSALEVVTKGEVVEDKRLEDKLDKLIKIDLEILRKLDQK